MVESRTTVNHVECCHLESDFQLSKDAKKGSVSVFFLRWHDISYAMVSSRSDVSLLWRYALLDATFSNEISLVGLSMMIQGIFAPKDAVQALCHTLA